MMSNSEKILVVGADGWIISKAVRVDTWDEYEKVCAALRDTITALNMKPGDDVVDTAKRLRSELNAAKLHAAEMHGDWATARTAIGAGDGVGLVPAANALRRERDLLRSAIETQRADFAKIRMALGAMLSETTLDAAVRVRRAADAPTTTEVTLQKLRVAVRRMLAALGLRRNPAGKWESTCPVDDDEQAALAELCNVL